MKFNWKKKGEMATRLISFLPPTLAENYMQYPRGNKPVPGGLGLGQQTATNLSNAFLLVSFVAPVPFAVVSDMWYGRYKTLMISLGLYLCGAFVLFVTALPQSLDHNAGLPGLISGMILISIGVGGVKATLPPFLGIYEVFFFCLIVFVLGNATARISCLDRLAL